MCRELWRRQINYSNGFEKNHEDEKISAVNKFKIIIIILNGS